ncbi:MAG: hypothetical protein GEU96_00820 [Propionibacteriales bacterium]|nr:hypothetical protein [Propionibacteriales bacterium]
MRSDIVELRGDAPQVTHLELGHIDVTVELGEAGASVSMGRPAHPEQVLRVDAQTLFEILSSLPVSASDLSAHPGLEIVTGGRRSAARWLSCFSGPNSAAA